jgi:hypothetical protein
MPPHANKLSSHQSSFLHYHSVEGDLKNIYIRAMDIDGSGIKMLSVDLGFQALVM